MRNLSFAALAFVMFTGPVMAEPTDPVVAKCAGLLHTCFHQNYAKAVDYAYGITEGDKVYVGDCQIICNTGVGSLGLRVDGGGCELPPPASIESDPCVVRCAVALQAEDREDSGYLVCD